MTPRRTSLGGVKFIAGFEGFRSKPYDDGTGVWTIGYGHTHGVTRHTKPISRLRGLWLLRQDLRIAETAVRQCVRVPLTQRQFNALVSFAFNVGGGALAGSTLLRKLNLRQYHGAANEFLKWNRAGGRVLAGLTRRRKAERAMFLRGTK